MSEPLYDFLITFKTTSLDPLCCSVIGIDAALLHRKDKKLEKSYSSSVSPFEEDFDLDMSTSEYLGLKGDEEDIRNQLLSWDSADSVFLALHKLGMYWERPRLFIWGGFSMIVFERWFEDAYNLFNRNNPNSLLHPKAYKLVNSFSLPAVDIQSLAIIQLRSQNLRSFGFDSVSKHLSHGKQPHLSRAIELAQVYRKLDL